MYSVYKFFRDFISAKMTNKLSPVELPSKKETFGKTPPATPRPLSSGDYVKSPSTLQKITKPKTAGHVAKGSKTAAPTKAIENNSSSSSKKSPKHESKQCTDVMVALQKQGQQTNCSDIYVDSNCPCGSYDVIPKRNPLAMRSAMIPDKRFVIPLERLNELRKKVQDAIKHHKVFTIRGCFYTIRKSLVQRGWVEKLDLHRRISQNVSSNFLIEELVQQMPVRRPGESRRQHVLKCERNLMSRLLEYVAVDFLWTCRKEKSDWLDMVRNPSLVVNKFNKVPYTSKEGLCTVLKDFHWFYEEGTAELYFPRCYNVWNTDEFSEFMENFKMTATISVLRWVVETSKAKGVNEISAPGGKVPLSCISFAINRCTDFISNCLHLDIDNENIGVRIWEHDWDVFYTQHHLLTAENAKFQTTSITPIEPYLQAAEKTLEEIKLYWAQYNLDGVQNIWIVKPGNRCRGRGIQVMNNLKDILTLVSPQMMSKTRYVVQKYIERPLIIHNTKFDIRQWFLVTSVQPLTVWMYKESYLRFSSQTFNLNNYHESVHLTNHAIQKKYTNCGARDERLPQENMWDCVTFQAYLRQIGQMDMWNERIYPGMQKAIIGTMLASQDNMDRRAHSFELYGADFMISEDFYPWLIEINSSPDLGATTSVTSRLCPQCLEDILKVVIDRRASPAVDTGAFEMIYKQVIPPAPAYMGLNLFLKGQQLMTKGIVKRDKYREESKSIRPVPKSKPSPIPVTPVPTQGPVIVDFMEYLNSSKGKAQLAGHHATGDVRKLNGHQIINQAKMAKKMRRPNS